MARFEITAPDGSKWEIEAPDGATEDQVVAYAKSQWVAKSQPEQEQKLHDDPGFGRSLLIGTGRTFDRIGKGMQQLYYGAKSKLESPDITSLVTSGGKTPSQVKLEELKWHADNDDRLYKPLQEARPWATGIGEALPTAVVPIGSAPTLLGTAGRMALAGAIPGALEYGTAEQRALRAGAGAIGGAAVPVIGAGAKTGKAFIEPLLERGRQTIAGRTLNRAAGEASDVVRQRLASAAELVPGSAPTAAEVADSGGIAAMQRAAAAMNPEPYTQRAMQQASARLNALRGIAGTDAEKAAAEATREAAAAKSYGHAFRTSIDTEMASALQPQIDNLMARPSMQKAMSKARELASEASLSFDEMGSTQGLHYLKLALDDLVEEAAKNPTKQGLIKQTARDLQLVLEQIAPEYRAANQRYAGLSAPINRMEVGRALQDKLQGALADYGGLASEQGANFAQALRGADALAARATNFPGMTLQRAVGQQGVQTLEAIGADLARKSNAQNLGRGVGSDTFQKLSMGNIAAQSGMPRAVGGLLDFPGVGRATAWAYKETDQKLQSMLADALLDPAKAADLMARADKRWLAENPKIRLALAQAAASGGGLLGLMPAQATANSVLGANQ